MISQEDFIVIHSLYEKGSSISAIARLTKLDRKTVRKRLKEIELKPSKHKVIKPSKLDLYKPYINEFISKSDHRIPYTVILNDIRAMGYSGGKTILQDYLTLEYQKLCIVSEPVVRFETLPGEQMQVDWTTIRKGKNPIYGFVATLGFSRHSFVCFTDNMSAETLITCHERAFLFFGGITQTILYDNMKAVVDKRNYYGRGLHKYHPHLYDLSKRFGFKIKLCKPYRPETKGKVENFNKYLKNNFYRPLAVKLKAAHLLITCEVLNNYISPWLNNANSRVHGTTKQKPCDLLKEELAYLLPYLTATKAQVEYGTTEQRLPQKQTILPITLVERTNLVEYDQLLTGAVA